MLNTNIWGMTMIQRRISLKVPTSSKQPLYTIYSEMMMLPETKPIKDGRRHHRAINLPVQPKTIRLVWTLNHLSPSSPTRSLLGERSVLPSVTKCLNWKRESQRRMVWSEAPARCTCPVYFPFGDPEEIPSEPGISDSPNLYAPKTKHGLRTHTDSSVP